MIPKINQAISFLEKILALVVNLFWIPSFISPPNDTPVDFITKDWYVLSGKYKEGTFNFYPAKYESAKAWRPRIHVVLPKFKERALSFSNVTFLFNPQSDKVWEYKDLAGQKHHVTYNTRKLMEDNPFNTTVEDKGTRIKEQTEKARKKRHAKVEAIKGNSL